MALENYTVELIPNRMALEMAVEHHYLHRKAPSMFSYGLFDGFMMIGCIIYGKPANQQLCKGVCGIEESSAVLELTRLWILDGTPKNTESFFIGKTLKLLPTNYDIIVSYAEINAGHIGTVYQATNWIYTGMSDKHKHWELDGKSSHNRHLFDEHGGTEKALEFYGDRLKLVERGRKHRYVMLRGSKKRKKDLLTKLRYPILAYPKNYE